jgi:hypothetical protein
MNQFDDQSPAYSIRPGTATAQNNGHDGPPEEKSVQNDNHAAEPRPSGGNEWQNIELTDLTPTNNNAVPNANANADLEAGHEAPRSRYLPIRYFHKYDERPMTGCQQAFSFVCFVFCMGILVVGLVYLIAAILDALS